MKMIQEMTDQGIIDCLKFYRWFKRIPKKIKKIPEKILKPILNIPKMAVS
jgi:hypothetical protein